MATLENPQPRQPAEVSWYDCVAGQLDALIPRFGLASAWGRVHRAYDLICRASLDGHPVGLMRSSRLNHDGTPIQFALALGQQPVALQFLSETGDPGSSCFESRKVIGETVRALFPLLQLQGDLESVLALVDSASGHGARWRGNILGRRGLCGWRKIRHQGLHQWEERHGKAALVQVRQLR